MVRQAIALTLLLAASNAAQHYYIYYKVVTSGQLVIEESLKISEAMTPFKGKPKTLCTFQTEQKNFRNWAKNNSAKLSECLLFHSANIKSFNSYDSFVPQKNLDILTTAIVPIQVEFNDGLVTIKKIQ